MIMLGTSLGIYCQGKTELSIILLKGLRKIVTKEQNHQHNNSFIITLISTTIRYQKKNGQRNIPRMLKLSH